MAKPKIRVIFYEDKKGVVHSFTHLEKRDSLRAIKILKLLPKLQRVTPSFEIAERIGENLAATLSTIYKLAGAKWLDIQTSEGRQTIAEGPILFVHKEEFSRRNNFKTQKHLCATSYVKLPASLK